MQLRTQNKDRSKDSGVIGVTKKDENDSMDEILINTKQEIKEQEQQKQTSEDKIPTEESIMENEEAEEILPVENPRAVIEAVLFTMGNSVEIKKLARILGRDEAETTTLIHEMQADYDRDQDRGITLMELDTSVQMCSKNEMYEYLVRIAKTPKNYVLTDTVLETLSIIAYKQPVTRLEIEKIRGVSCDHAVNKLIEYGLVTELGRLDAPGRPLLFGTTEEFLRSFGVRSLDELPMVAPDRLEEFKKEAVEEVQLKLDV